MGASKHNSFEQVKNWVLVSNRALFMRLFLCRIEHDKKKVFFLFMIEFILFIILRFGLVLMSSFSLISAVLTNECVCCFLKSGKTTKKNDSYLYKDINLKDADKH